MTYTVALTAGLFPACGLALDSTTTFETSAYTANIASQGDFSCSWTWTPSLGYHYVSINQVEYNNSASTFYNMAASGSIQG